MKTVQILLNLNLGALIPLRPVATDGAIGDGTIGAIAEFQRRVLGAAAPDGRVDPGGGTLRALRTGASPAFSADVLAGIMIHATNANVLRYAGMLEASMTTYHINTPLRRAHFLAQLAHESAELRCAEEIASGAAYEGRADLGNTKKGDGVKFKGRGLIQLTGRTNYTAYGKARGQDYVTGDNPKLIATDPSLAVDVACWFWEEHDLNTKADLDDVMAVTRRINGGYNGIDDRRVKLERAKFFLLR